MTSPSQNSKHLQLFLKRITEQAVTRKHTLCAMNVSWFSSILSDAVTFTGLNLATKGRLRGSGWGKLLCKKSSLMWRKTWNAHCSGAVWGHGSRFKISSHMQVKLLWMTMPLMDVFIYSRRKNVNDFIRKLDPLLYQEHSLMAHFFTFSFFIF